MSSPEKTVALQLTKKQAEMLVQMCEGTAAKGPDARALADLYDKSVVAAAAAQP